MSLLDHSIRTPGLLAHRRLTFTRERAATTETNAETGAPTTSVITSKVLGYHQWLSGIEAQDFKGDTSAALITLPGQLMAGDIITHATLGRFIVLEEGPQPHGPFDRVPLKRA